MIVPDVGQRVGHVLGLVADPVPVLGAQPVTLRDFWRRHWDLGGVEGTRRRR